MPGAGAGAVGELGEGEEKLQRKMRKSLGMIDRFILIVVIVSWVKTFQIAHFKYMQFFVFPSYLNAFFNESKTPFWFIGIF